MNTTLARLSDVNDLDVAPDEPDIRGWDVVAADDATIGEVSDLIVDRSAMKVRYVEIDLDGDELHLDDDRTVIAPIQQVQLDTDRHEVVLPGMSRQQIVALPESRDGQWDQGTMVANNAQSPAPPPPNPSANRGASTSGRADTGATRLTRSAEELKIGKRAVEAGQVRVGKHVETEHVSQPVTKTRERVVVERRPVSGEARADATISESGEIRVPVMEEEVVVEKRPVVKEELVISKERVSDTQTVEADLKREEFDVQKDGHVDVDDSRARRGGDR